MFELDVRREFSAAHRLVNYNGNCSKLHGHNWIVEVYIQSSKLDQVGIAMDFKVLKKELDALLEEMDHSFLNDLPAFRDCNPTSENIARYLYTVLKAKINTDTVKVSRVRICESPTSGASYYE